MKLTRLVILLFISTGVAVGQQSMFQSFDGQTSIFLSAQNTPGVFVSCPSQSSSGESPSPGGSAASGTTPAKEKGATDKSSGSKGGCAQTNVGVASFNFSSSTGQVGFLHSTSDVKLWAYGFDVAGTFKNSSVSIIHNNATAPGVSLRAGAIRRLKRYDPRNVKEGAPKDFKCTLCSDWLVFQARYDVSQFYTVPTSMPPFPTPVKQLFNSGQGKIGYNALLKSSNADFLVGLTVGVGQFNNTASLMSAQYTDNMITTTGGNQLVINQSSQTVYVGKYKTYVGVPINADAVIFPGFLSGMIGVDFFVRSNVTNADLYANPGVGLFFSKKGQPARPIGGITGSYANGKGQVGIVAGWSF